MESEKELDKEFIAMMQEFTDRHEVSQAQLITLFARAIVTVTNWTRPQDD